MSKESLGRTIGAASVVLSLVFVGLEIRQNTAVARDAAYREMMTGITAAFTPIIEDPELAALYTRVVRGALPEDLEPEQSLRMALSVTVQVRQWEAVYYSVEEGILPREVLETVGGGGLLDTPFFHAIWPTMRESLTRDFVSFIEDSRFFGS